MLFLLQILPTFVTFNISKITKLFWCLQDSCCLLIQKIIVLYKILLIDPCGKRTTKWKFFAGQVILGHNKKTISNIQNSIDCQRLCLQEVDFLCKSFEILSGTCFLSDKSRSDVPSKFVRWPGYIYKEWYCETGNCAAQSEKFNLYPVEMVRNKGIEMIKITIC